MKASMVCNYGSIEEATYKAIFNWLFDIIYTWFMGENLEESDNFISAAIQNFDGRTRRYPMSKFIYDVVDIIHKLQESDL